MAISNGSEITVSDLNDLFDTTGTVDIDTGSGSSAQPSLLASLETENDQDAHVYQLNFWADNITATSDGTTKTIVFLHPGVADILAVGLTQTSAGTNNDVLSFNIEGQYTDHPEIMPDITKPAHFLLTEPIDVSVTADGVAAVQSATRYLPNTDSAGSLVPRQVLVFDLYEAKITATGTGVYDRIHAFVLLRTYRRIGK